MQQFIRFLLIPGLLGWLLGGCAQKIDPKPPTYSQLLTGTDKKAWRLVSFQVIDDGNASDVLPISQFGSSTCRTDDQYVFYTNAEHQFDYVNGATKCSASEADVLFTDSWDLVNASATLQFTIPIFDGGNVLPYKIKNLTQNSMTVEIYFDKVFPAPDNINASYRFTFNPVTTK